MVRGAEEGSVLSKVLKQRKEQYMYAVSWLRKGIFAVVFLSLCTMGYAYKDKKKQVEAPSLEPVAVPVLDIAPAADAAPAMPSEEELMAKMKEYATPNENHKALEAFVGSWDYSLKMWKSPDKEPEVSSGSSEAKWILDGRFVEQTATGTAHGMPFEGRGILGYDNAKKEFISSWIDNMGTGMMLTTGTYDAATKTFTEKGSMVCPVMGQMSFRSEIKIVDDNTHTYEMYMTTPDGGEAKALEITYTRKAPAG